MKNSSIVEIKAAPLTLNTDRRYCRFDDGWFVGSDEPDCLRNILRGPDVSALRSLGLFLQHSAAQVSGQGLDPELIASGFLIRPEAFWEERLLLWYRVQASWPEVSFMSINESCLKAAAKEAGGVICLKEGKDTLNFSQEGKLSTPNSAKACTLAWIVDAVLVPEENRLPKALYLLSGKLSETQVEAAEVGIMTFTPEGDPVLS